MFDFHDCAVLHPSVRQYKR